VSLVEELSLIREEFFPASVCDRVACDSLAPFRFVSPFRFAVQYIVSSPSQKGYKPGLTLSYAIGSNVAVAIP